MMSTWRSPTKRGTSLMWTTYSCGYSMTPPQRLWPLLWWLLIPTSLLVLLGRRISAEKQSPIYRASLFQHMKTPSVCALESENYINASSGSSSVHSSHSVQPSASDYDNWWKHIEVCKWNDRKKQSYWWLLSLLLLTEDGDWRSFQWWSCCNSWKNEYLQSLTLQTLWVSVNLFLVLELWVCHVAQTTRAELNSFK